MKVGILAIQGNFENHRRRLNELGASTLLVKKPTDLCAVSGIVLPGGESSAMLKLMAPELWQQLKQSIAEGLPTLATCAGVILLARNVSNPTQPAFDLLDIDVARNAYGRQKESFITADLSWTPAGRSELTHQPTLADLENEMLEGVFIRAPKIIRTGADVTTLMTLRDEPVLVGRGSILGATFHPEMSQNATAIHRLFLAHVNGAKFNSVSHRRTEIQ